MKGTVTPEAEHAIAAIAERHGLSREAVMAMLVAVHAGGGTMAQFSIPELGGSGQWMQGGMTMVGGNMFDNALKARVDALCGELAQLIGTTTVFPASTKGRHAAFTTGNWWPADLGVPTASGGQNDARYAIFPSARRLAIQMNGVDKSFRHRRSSDRRRSTAAGRQGRHGPVHEPVRYLRRVEPHRARCAAGDRHPGRAATQHRAGAYPSATGDPATIIAAIESLAGLHQRGILSDEEFAAKKADLLDRL